MIVCCSHIFMFSCLLSFVPLVICRLDILNSIMREVSNITEV